MTNYYDKEDATYWLDRWKQQNIGFHKDSFNEELLANAASLGSLDGKTVFVPLSGKTLDMIWFLEHGAKVIGIDLSDMAAEAFFAENNMPFEKQVCGDFFKYSAHNITFFCGDVFGLTSDITGHIDFIYDRAALIALPIQDRSKYIETLCELLPLGGKIFLIAMETDIKQNDTAPFSISKQDVECLFAEKFAIKLLSSRQAADLPKHLVARGMRTAINNTYILTFKHSRIHLGSQ
jgi:thiopurine S-methyltransferase